MLGLVKNQIFKYSSKINVDLWNKELNSSLKDLDPEVFDIIEHEKRRQITGIELIPSENFTSQAVLDALGTIMQNKYSEGYPGHRYYGGNEFIDQSENLCMKRALEAFHLNPEEWGVNVQSLSGSPANFQVYSALLKPHDRIYALDLPHGGHLSHGYQTPQKKISAVSIFFETLPYRVNEKTGYIDYDIIEKNAKLYRPKIIVCGASAYPRHIDYKRFREIADDNDSYLMCDMAHISGLIAAQVLPSPFEYCDVVTTTTHKSLRGPRHAMIFYRKGKRVVKKHIEGKKEPKIIESKYDIEEKINFSVFPGLQGGPHNHTITALAVALKLAQSPMFREYQEQVLKNSKILAEELKKLGYDLVSGGTDNHLMLLDLHSQNIDGARVEKVCDLANIACNKNTVPGDKSALVPHGIRLGSPPMTTRGFLEDDFKKIAEFVHKAIQITIKAKKDCKGKKIVDFFEFIEKPENREKYGIEKLRAEVEKFSTKNYAVGFKINEMKYPPKQ